MNRGAGHQDIFHDASYYEIFLSLLEDILKEYHVEVHAYCLMSNHYHLLLKTVNSNLSSAMRYVNGMFARKHNYLREWDGHVFRGRYKAIPIDNDDYLLYLSRRIHLNPVAAKLCQLPEQYPWSSYNYYIQDNMRPIWLFCEHILDNFQPGNKIENYKKFVSQGLKSDLEILSFKKRKMTIPYRINIDQGDIGNDLELSNSKLQNNKPPREALEQDKMKAIGPEEALEQDKRSIIIESRILLANRIVDKVSDYFKIDSSMIRMNKSKTIHNYPRKIAIYLLCRVYYIDHDTIAEIIQDISRSGITKLCQRIQLEIKNHSELSTELNNIKLYCDMGLKNNKHSLY